ncbi:MAG: hypothetical protein K0S38_338 [Candidatus Paceibacter sp.]|jgi:hypothetical protein|nr:hypothetical protein [Candidatus Paceibacter sp.]
MLTVKVIVVVVIAVVCIGCFWEAKIHFSRRIRMTYTDRRKTDMRVLDNLKKRGINFGYACGYAVLGLICLTVFVYLFARFFISTRPV